MLLRGNNLRCECPFLDRKVERHYCSEYDLFILWTIKLITLSDAITIIADDLKSSYI